ncbi:MAG TPA: hypothetical protein VE403_02295 [Sphingomicrobium sp.]|jgi:hypothetical protein|nr:hypothetical protein [Sphingomicrobium sp.]
MAQPLHSRKQAVDLASAGPRVSRIRRDPPPAVKQTIVELEESDQTIVVVGVLVFALSIFVLVLAFGIYSTWSPSEYTIELNDGA